MPLPTLTDADFQSLYRFAISLGLGLLIGLERERNPAALAGLRTFAITALLGTLSALLSQAAGSPWIMVASLLAVAAFITGAYWGKHEADPGTTTQVALLACFALGAMIWYGEHTLAIMLAIVITALLYFKTELEGISRNLTRRDLVSMLQFAVVTFIVLPLLPNTNVGPYQTLNPYQIWLMVALISGISLAGYVALRVFGARHGAVLLGVLGGLVSSTATTLIYARHGRAPGKPNQLAATVILLANLVVLPRLLLLVAVLAPALLLRTTLVLGAGFLAGIAVILLHWRTLRHDGELAMPEIKNPAELRVALSFGAVYATVLVASAWLADYAGDKGLYALAFVSGLTDVDAITLSTLRLLTLGQTQAPAALTAIVLALWANLLFRLGLTAIVGNRPLAWRCLPGLAAVGIGAGLGLLLL